MKSWHYIFLISFFSYFTNSQDVNFQKTLDTVQKLRKLSTLETLDLGTRLKYAQEASQLSYKTKVDSTILLSDRNRLTVHLKKLDHKMIYDLSKKNLKLATKLNDSIAILRSYIALGYSFMKNSINIDSSYHYYLKALNISKKLNNKLETVFILNNISILTRNKEDYANSEKACIEGINILKTLPKNDQNLDYLVSFLLHSGLNAKYLKQFDKALNIYNEALLVNKDLKNINSCKSCYTYNEENYLFLNVNIAEVYRKKKKFKKAISIYKELLNKNRNFSKDSMLIKDPLTYSAIANNMAYCLFLSKNKDTTQIKLLFNEAYKISDSLNALYEIVAGGNDMAEFYQSINKKDSALILSKRSFKIGRKIKEFQEVSRSLMLLSKLEEGEKGKQYLYEHIKLNDSLLQVERASRNKFARIKFETDNYIAETKKLTSQNAFTFLIILMSLFVLVLFYIIRVQISKNQELAFIGKQQKANKRIYDLLLNQQSKIEETRLAERHNIGEALNDGILNKLSGSRLGLEFLALEDNAVIQDRYHTYITELQNVEKEIRDISHNLKNEGLYDDSNYIKLIEDYLNKHKKDHLLQYTIKSTTLINWQNINDDLKVNIFRIIQEVANGIKKHKTSDTLTVNISLTPEECLILNIHTNLGWSTKQINQSRRVKNIKTIVKNSNGTIHMESTYKKETVLSINLQLN
ncbi:sensor histidine kinase [Seonamhaeicola marinus]|uniref:Tetratricopeptide repeat protein n=1 Tax=Seonamhaeicola marinus TaxID=1912246 RepID=A0A5D0HMF2_9FLAO|nr:hypothetical protein [Seonamhaeicola marinus]TYA71519.1 hypothetical protein FUA24_18245 [Seonamhaeicola marinus]